VNSATAQPASKRERPDYATGASSILTRAPSGFSLGVSLQPVAHWLARLAAVGHLPSRDTSAWPYCARAVCEQCALSLGLHFHAGAPKLRGAQICSHFWMGSGPLPVGLSERSWPKESGELGARVWARQLPAFGGFFVQFGPKVWLEFRPLGKKWNNFQAAAQS